MLGLFGGYTETKGPGELIRVGFGGNGYSSSEKVGSYHLYRCAEIARRENRSYFAVYRSLSDAIQDKRSADKPVGSYLGMPDTFAYILFFDAPEPGLLSTSEVLEQLEPVVHGARSQ